MVYYPVQGMKLRQILGRGNFKRSSRGEFHMIATILTDAAVFRGLDELVGARELKRRDVDIGIGGALDHLLARVKRYFATFGPACARQPRR
jgi:hypothetical protein